MNETNICARVAELQGLYGPLRVLEGKIQQVWGLEQWQHGDWETRDGVRLRVHAPGLWNRGAGPDFREAVLEFDGEIRVGDVEIHLYREDWWRHGHDIDPTYNNVILHVVLFAGGMGRPILTEGGSSPEEWVMGPWMCEDIEAVSGGEPGLFGELVPELREWLESDVPEVLRQRLQMGADRRWQDKESMARCLHELAGWEGGLHRMILYYLGFPFNRRSFYEMAEAHPREDWADEALLGGLRVTWENKVRWNMGRPANRALARLGQYVALNLRVEDWPSRLISLPESLLADSRDGVFMYMGSVTTRQLRQEGGLTRCRKWLKDSALGGVFSQSLTDRLWIDVFLPMLVVEGCLSREEAVILWFHGYPAQYPSAYNELLRLVGIQLSPGLPRCNGWIQGLLWLEDQLRLERIRSSTNR